MKYLGKKKQQPRVKLMWSCITMAAAVLFMSERLIVERDDGRGCHDITAGQTEKADSRLKAEQVDKRRINTEVQRTSEEKKHLLTRRRGRLLLSLSTPSLSLEGTRRAGEQNK